MTQYLSLDKVNQRFASTDLDSTIVNISNLIPSDAQIITLFF